MEVEMSVTLVTSSGEQVTLDSRAIKGSDLSTVAADLNASHIPNNDTSTFSGQTTLADVLTYLNTVRGEKGDQGDGITSITSTTDSNGYTSLLIQYGFNNQTTVSLPSIDGEDGRGVSSVSLGNDANNSANYALTFTYDDASTDTVTFAKPVDGTTPKEISSASLGTDANNSANYALPLPMTMLRQIH